VTFRMPLPARPAMIRTAILALLLAGFGAHQQAAHQLQAAEERLLKAAPILPIYHYVSRSLVAPDLAGWQDNAMNIHPSRLLYRVKR